MRSRDTILLAVRAHRLRREGRTVEAAQASHEAARLATEDADEVAARKARLRAAARGDFSGYGH